ncbi:methylated-DNA--[protein]-cysteine S-methyltransferase [Microvirga rosea]|uniref:methylated-DNA--[protein]-cysteine S-methyltransferase n=1 Tax=Microvirga rosea TaxID=2715425 RepID=UPI001D0B1BCD|nr:methylated-DNA--[protein]-cysteine S-methyltransferase [Microvirga rosea]MCB8820185.1 methylated-DNA--[protein]-cysteine S-methyltransferase [Microvirga rosea]
MIPLSMTEAAAPRLLIIGRVATPIGAAVVAVDEREVLRALFFEEFEERMSRSLRIQYRTLPVETGPVPAPIGRALEAYFGGDGSALKDLHWMTAGTPFQKAVWNALMDIPFGQTLSYGTLAARLGMPKAVRAVGLANGANPISVVVPCHRVVGADGSLTGYGGGLHRKRWLLAHEGVLCADQPSLL